MSTKKEEQPKEENSLVEAQPKVEKAKEALKKNKSYFIKVAKVLKSPVVTEKSAMLSKNNNEYVFKVNVKSTKTEIKKSIEELYGVKVESVNTIIRKGKSIRFGKTVGTRSDEKFAIIKVKQGQDINVLNKK